MENKKNDTPKDPTFFAAGGKTGLENPIDNVLNNCGRRDAPAWAETNHDLALGTREFIVVRHTRKDTVKEYLTMAFGGLIVAFGIYFTFFPNHFAIGGVAGLAIVISTLLGEALSASTLNLIINLVLLIVGYIFFGKDFAFKTVFASMLIALSISFLEFAVPLSRPLTDQPFLELGLGVIVTSVGSAMIFSSKASSGGTDIIAMVLKKYTDLDIGSALLVTDFLIAFSTFFIYHNVELGMFCIMGLFLKSVAVDFVFDIFKTNKCFNIITSKPDEISQLIGKLRRGATVFAGKGSYTKNDKYLVVAIVSRRQAVKLRQACKEIDQSSFIYVTNTLDIMGNGFKHYN